MRRWLLRGGRLTSSEDDVNAHWQRAWDELDTYATWTGRELSMRQAAQRIWHAIGSPPVSTEPIETLIAEYLDAWIADVSLATGAAECPADLASDHTLAILSNTHDSQMVPRLTQRVGLSKTLASVLTSVDNGWRKPHPVIFRAALHQFNVTAQTVVFVGSTLVPTLRPCGEKAWLLDLDDNRVVRRWAAAIRRADLPGVREAVPGLTTLLVTVDPDRTNAAAVRAASYPPAAAPRCF
jgi:FMN phosphatase YigB (HAD superfamily)